MWALLTRIITTPELAMYFWIALGVVYLWVALCLFIVAIKENIPDPLLAWIPFLNIYYMLKIPDKPAWWIALLFVPIVNIIVYITTWMDIADMRDLPTWLGLLMLIPGVNLIVLGVMAFAPKG